MNIANTEQQASRKGRVVVQARLDTLLTQAAPSIITSLCLSLILLPVLWLEISHLYLILFVGYQSIVAFSRLMLVRYVSQKMANQEQPTLSQGQLLNYERWFAVGSFATGLGFGSLGLVITPDLTLKSLFIIPFVLAGLTTGAMLSMASSLKNYLAFVIPSMSLLSFGLYQSGLVVPAVMVLLYFFMMALMGRKLYYTFLDGVDIKGRNLDLVDNLTGQNQELELLLSKLDESERLSSSAFNNAGVTMMLVDRELQIFKVNREACLLLGYKERQLTSLGLLNLLYANDRESSHQLFQDLMAGKKQQYQSRKRYVRSDHVDIWVQEIVSAVYDENDQFDYAIVHAQDVTQEYRLTKKLSYQANHDVVTGLYNRYAFESRLQRLFMDDQNFSDEHKSQHVLCYIDLDQFKVVNDTYGHTVGDGLLRELANIFKANLRKSDVLARIGGDEFALLMLDCSIDAAKTQLGQLLEQMRESNFEYEGHLINTTASIGMVAFDCGHSMTDILKQADSACYAAKEAGRDRLHVYSQDDAFLVQRNGEMSWVSRIQRALSEKNFVLYSQEIVHIKRQDDLPHYELLIRMRGDDGKDIPPGLFLPAAEHYNLAAAIDLWVVEHVLESLSNARDAGESIRGVYGVNLSGHSLGDKRFYETIIAMFSDYDLADSGAQICFEITETAAILNMSSALHFINTLRSMGCLFALDDFGSGLSSYAYLQQMPIDFLKIDGMFVKDCLDDPVKLEMIRSINSVGHVMGVKTIAEFVENDAIFDQLGEIDVDYAQGYWNGVPIPWAFGHYSTAIDTQTTVSRGA